MTDKRYEEKRERKGKTYGGREREREDIHFFWSILRSFCIKNIVFAITQSSAAVNNFKKKQDWLRALSRFLEGVF